MRNPFITTNNMKSEAERVTNYALLDANNQQLENFKAEFEKEHGPRPPYNSVSYDEYEQMRHEMMHNKFGSVPGDYVSYNITDADKQEITKSYLNHIKRKAAISATTTALVLSSLFYSCNTVVGCNADQNVKIRTYVENKDRISRNMLNNLDEVVYHATHDTSDAFISYTPEQARDFMKLKDDFTKQLADSTAKYDAVITRADDKETKSWYNWIYGVVGAIIIGVSGSGIKRASIIKANKNASKVLKNYALITDDISFRE